MRRIGILTAFLTAILLVMGFVLLSQAKEPQSAQSDTARLKQFEDQKSDVSLSYPEEANQLQLTEQDKADKFIFRASHDSEPPYLITLRYEEGLLKASQLARISALELLLGNTDKAFPTRYPGYKKLSEQKFERAGKEAAKLEFTYTANDGQLAKQALYIFMRDDDTALYLSTQAKESDYPELEQLFSSTSESLKL
jgi:hypothetical protein